MIFYIKQYQVLRKYDSYPDMPIGTEDPYPLNTL